MKRLCLVGVKMVFVIRIVNFFVMDWATWFFMHCSSGSLTKYSNKSVVTRHLPLKSISVNHQTYSSVIMNIPLWNCVILIWPKFLNIFLVSSLVSIFNIKQVEKNHEFKSTNVRLCQWLCIICCCSELREEKKMTCSFYVWILLKLNIYRQMKRIWRIRKKKPN